MTDPYFAISRAVERSLQGSTDFDLNAEIILPKGRKLRTASVLIALQDTDCGPEILLTKRGSTLKHHPGQIAFPGGKIDDGDDGPISAALREAHEEVGLHPENVDILGTLSSHETVTGFIVTPVIARIRHEFCPKPEPGEVEEIFTVPFSHVTDVSRFQVQSRIWDNSLRHYYAIPYGPYYIWGATARILRGLAEGMAE